MEAIRRDGDTTTTLCVVMFAAAAEYVVSTQGATELSRFGMPLVFAAIWLAERRHVAGNRIGSPDVVVVGFVVLAATAALTSPGWFSIDERLLQYTPTLLVAPGVVGLGLLGWSRRASSSLLSWAAALAAVVAFAAVAGGDRQVTTANFERPPSVQEVLLQVGFGLVLAAASLRYRRASMSA